MKILFTGGSSFTGLWFVRELAAAGHEVHGRLPQRGRRIPRRRPRGSASCSLAEVCRPVHGCSFGDEAFLALVGEGGFDLLCHHAADVTNYKSPDFDASAPLRTTRGTSLSCFAALKAGEAGESS